MKISIIIPAYNEEKLLPRCLKSIFSAKLPESYEVIVVNNASTDRTEEIARSFTGVKVVNESKKGITKARQAGFLSATGDILVFFDADTLIPEDWFKIAVSKFKSNPKLVGVSGPYHFEAISWWARGLEWFYNYIIMPTGEFIWKYILRQGGIMLLGGNFAVRKEALVAVNGFNTEIDFFGEDTNLTRRIAKIGKIDFTNSLFVYSSPRRFRGEGGVRLAVKYIINFFGEWIFKKPVNKSYEDFR
ncbi:glycosyltransferase [Candidatus Falkowbacteria bacterium]|nr:glycosyltransferase [Candidatus Falkowbacteria bacterium]